MRRTLGIKTKNRVAVVQNIINADNRINEAVGYSSKTVDSGIQIAHKMTTL